MKEQKRTKTETKRKQGKNEKEIEIKIRFFCKEKTCKAETTRSLYYEFLIVNNMINTSFFFSSFLTRMRDYDL